MLSDYQVEIANLYNIPISNVKKLVPNVFDKETYVLHYEKFQLYLRLGLKLKKIHRVLEFNQPLWLKPNIENKDGKALYKLVNNIIYGKTMESLRNRIDIKLANNEKVYLKGTSKPSNISTKIFDNDLVAIRKSKLALKLNKAAYIGMCILVR